MFSEDVEIERRKSDVQQIDASCSDALTDDAMSYLFWHNDMNGGFCCST